MSKAKVVYLIVTAALLSGCAQRELNDYDRAAILGASESAALANARAAVGGNQELDAKEYNAHKHQHKHHLSDFERDQGEPVDTGVVYKHGKKGYYDAAGEFIQYAQSAHKHIKQNASLKQLSAEADAVVNGTIGDGADFLIGQGWKANKGVWHKQGYILKLVVEDGIIVNAQLTK